MKSNISKTWLVLRYGTNKYLYKNFKIFAPNSSGNSNVLGYHTEKSIKLTFPLISDLVNIINNKKTLITAKNFCLKKRKINEANKIKKLFNFYGSDKSNFHNYHFIYSSLFKNPKNVKNILEVGLGTNDQNLVSNMGKLGNPGASVKAFRDYFIKSNVYGADIDKRILFKDIRIKTFYVDQTNLKTIKRLYKKINKMFDLIIDDGLHVTYANINMIIASLKYLKKEGWLVIEDISFDTQSIWETISFILRKKYTTYLIKTNNTLIFLVNNNKKYKN